MALDVAHLKYNFVSAWISTIITENRTQAVEFEKIFKTANWVR